MAKNRLEKAGFPEFIDFHFLDLIQFRPLSNAIANTFNIEHASPQVLLISQGTAIYDTSHLDITMAALTEVVNSAGNNKA